MVLVLETQLEVELARSSDGVLESGGDTERVAYAVDPRGQDRTLWSCSSGKAPVRPTLKPDGTSTGR